MVHKWTFKREKSRAKLEKDEASLAVESSEPVPGTNTDSGVSRTKCAGASLVFANFLKRSVVITLLVSGLAACNKQPHQNAADLKAQESRQEFTLRMQEAEKARQLSLQKEQQTHELETAEIQADVDRHKQTLDAETERLHHKLVAENTRLDNHETTEMIKKVVPVTVIGGLIAGILGWRFHLSTIIKKEQERTKQIALLVEGVKSLSPEDRKAHFERMFSNSGTDQLIDISPN